jgi:uncharacterized protein (TIGR03086 family)
MGVTLDPADAYQRAAALFGETIAALSDDEWETATGEEWTVVTTVAWVVVGDSHIATAVAGEPLGSVGEFDAAVLGTAPVAAWRGTAVAAISALREPGALERTVRHPEGELLIADLVSQRVSENLVRAWDIGEAVDRPVEIPDDLAGWCLDFWADHTDVILAGGVLPDVPVQPPADAGLVERFLAVTGRRA